jgi:hypothetical protein
MNLYRRNLLRSLYPANANPAIAPLEIEISDQEAFGLSKFCRWVGTELDIEPLMPADAALLLQLETEPCIASIRAIDGDMHVSHLLVSAAVIRLLLSMAADPSTPMFAGSRSIANQFRQQLTACTVLHLSVLYQPADRQGHAVTPINPLPSCSMPA